MEHKYDVTILRYYHAEDYAKFNIMPTPNQKFHLYSE